MCAALKRRRWMVRLEHPAGSIQGHEFILLCASRRAMSRMELVLTYAVVALMMALMVGVGDYIQRESKGRLAEEMVLTLREAVVAYHAAIGRYPPGRLDGRSEQAITEMLGEESSRAVLSDWPVLPNNGLDSPSAFVDPWGVAFRYSAAPNHAEVPSMTRGRGMDPIPVFVSAGPDRDFGDLDSRRQQDNLSSDIPMVFKSRD